MANVEAREPKKQTWPLAEIAYAIDVTPTRVNQLVRQGVLERKGPGAFDVVSTVRRYIGFIRGTRATVEAKADTVGSAKADLLQSRAALTRIELELKQGTVAKVADFELTWTRAVERMRQRLLAIPSKVAPLVAVEDDANACMEIVEELVHEALEELSNVDVRVAQGPGPGGAGTPPSDDVSQATDEDDDLDVGGLEEATEP